MKSLLYKLYCIGFYVKEKYICPTLSLYVSLSYFPISITQASLKSVVLLINFIFS